MFSLYGGRGSAAAGSSGGGSAAAGSSGGGSAAVGSAAGGSAVAGSLVMEQEAVVAVVEQEEVTEDTEDVEAGLLKDSLDNNTDMDIEDDSDGVSVADSISQNTDIYSLEEINHFLDETFGKPVSLSNYFPDGEKFIQTVNTLDKVVSLELLDEKKRYRLKKHVTAIGKQLKKSKSKRMTKMKVSK